MTTINTTPASADELGTLLAQIAAYTSTTAVFSIKTTAR